MPISGGPQQGKHFLPLVHGADAADKKQQCDRACEKQPQVPLRIPPESGIRAFVHQKLLIKRSLFSLQILQLLPHQIEPVLQIFQFRLDLELPEKVAAAGLAADLHQLQPEGVQALLLLRHELQSLFRDRPMEKVYIVLIGGVPGERIVGGAEDVDGLIDPPG